MGPLKLILSNRACGPDFQSVLKNHLAVAVVAAAANVVAAAVNTFFSLKNTPAQVTAGGIFLSFFLSFFYPQLSVCVCFRLNVKLIAKR